MLTLIRKKSIYIYIFLNLNDISVIFSWKFCFINPNPCQKIVTGTDWMNSKLIWNPNNFNQFVQSTNWGHFWLESRVKSSGNGTKMKNPVTLSCFNSKNLRSFKSTQSDCIVHIFVSFPIDLKWLQVENRWIDFNSLIFDTGNVFEL